MNTEQHAEHIVHSKPETPPLKILISIEELFSPSNIITLSRIGLLPFIVFFLINDLRYIALMFMMILLISDALDGYVARKLNQVSDTGKFLDPLCDKIALTVILVTLYSIGSLPFWGVIIIVSRDILILLGSFLLIKHKAVLFKSNVMGKITGFIFGLIICAFTVNLTRVGVILLYICIPALIASFTIYLSRYLRVMKGEA